MSANPFQRPDEAKEISEVNVVPLADVSLVLLIILLLLSPMMTQSMVHVKTAAKDSAPPPPAPDEAPLSTPPPSEVVLAVALTPAGYSVGDKSFASKDELRSYLADALLHRTDKKVFLSPHPDVTHGDVVAALDLIKQAGADSVALVQTEEPQPDGEVRAAAPAP